LLLTARPPQLYPLFTSIFFDCFLASALFSSVTDNYSIFKTGRNFIRIDALDHNSDMASGQWLSP
jgi:hypothetical protein